MFLIFRECEPRIVLNFLLNVRLGSYKKRVYFTNKNYFDVNLFIYFIFILLRQKLYNCNRNNNSIYNVSME